MSISLRIKELMAKKKLSQKRLASILMIDPSQFSKIVNGKLQPTLPQLMELSSTIQVSLDWLCFGKLEENPPDRNEGIKDKLIVMQEKEIARLEDEVRDLKTKLEYNSSVERGAVEFLNEPKLR